MIKIRQVTIPVGNNDLTATISKPDIAKGIVIFSHGLGSGRFSPRNVKIANRLQDAGFATLLCDLHDKQEVDSEGIEFNIQEMALRLEMIVLWLKNQTQYEMLHPALYGSSTGAAAAIKVASELNGVIKALVCRGGRIEFAREFIDKVSSPTLLIVGELDFHLLEVHRKIFNRLNAKKEMAIIPGATHLFEEPKKLDEVAKISIEWFDKFLNHPDPEYSQTEHKDSVER
ncbi:MAG: dienelactone hydrolase family protein [Balneolaceae bacterium]|nr:dienelactone hydrolase family protein [Balneolaceae bacterium]MDR9410236.1 dienelactone hydrolase family protein [Balneolaceae bacterium]